jgi:hypothetical protein
MKKMMLKLASGILLIALITASTYAEDGQDQDQQTVSAGSKKLDDEQHLAIKQKRAEEAKEENARGEMVTNGMYLTTHPMASHGVYKTSALFDVVELNDGSVWNVWYSADRSVVGRWQYMNDQVIICPGTLFDPTDYLLVSQRTGEQVPVKLVEMEIIAGDPTFHGQRLWIYSMNYIFDLACNCFYYEIRLNDGSLWEVDTRDSYLCSYMNPGDVVIVGVDEKFGASTYNILIHFNSLEYVHADCATR